MQPCQNKIIALHGFLGSPSDWALFDFIDHQAEITSEALDFWSWSAQFNSLVKRDGRKNILLGYSMGGRLAMHALIANPTLWDAAILVSAHPGLDSKEQRLLRLKSDRIWADRFLNDPWNILLRDWNANPVFGATQFPFVREESSFNRKRLSQQLINWSLGNQEDLLPKLKELSIPLLTLAGKLDTKFCTIADQFKEFSKVSIIPEAAHRIPWDQSSKFINEIKTFIGEI